MAGPEAHFTHLIGLTLPAHGHEPAWLLERRRAAADRFAALGFPTTHDEAWRQTSVKSLVAHPFTLAEPATVTPEQIAPLRVPGAHVLVYINGHHDAALSDTFTLPEGCGWGSLAQSIAVFPALWEEPLQRRPIASINAFEALNEALWEGGAFLYIAKDALVDTPIQILHVLTGTDPALINMPKTVIVLESGAKASVIQTAAGLSTGHRLHCGVTELHLREGATLDHYHIQRQRHDASSIGTIHIWQDAASTLDSDVVTLGGALVRTQINVELLGEQATAVLNGLYVLDGDRHADLITLIDHAVPHTTSQQRFKGILDDHSHGVFTGKVIVRPNAQKISAEQSNPNLLLSDDAVINSQPQLEIYADDVKCSHGATIGQLDDDALFYLQSRGIDLESAQAILTYAFAADVISDMALPSLRGQLGEILMGTLLHGGMPAEVASLFAGEVPE